MSPIFLHRIGCVKLFEAIAKMNKNPYSNREIHMLFKHDFKLSKPSNTVPSGLVFKQLPRDPANANA